MIADLPGILILVFTFVVGLSLGSFTTCVVYRVPRGLSVWRNDKNSAAYRSFCPHCKTPLTTKDLIPVFSWFFLRGRCRHCGKPIGTVYPMIEIGVTFLVVGIFATHGVSLTSLVLCILIPCVAAIWAFFALKPRL